MNRATSVALLGAAIAAGLGAYWLFGEDGRPRAVPPVAQDDLELVAALLDASPAEAPRDQLVATPEAVYLAHAADRAVTVTGTITPPTTSDAGASRVLAHLDAPARGMAYAAGALWITARHSVLRIPVGGGEARPVAELGRPGSIACDATSIFVVDVDPATTGLTHANTVVRIPAAGRGHTVLGRSDGEITNVVVDDASVYWADRLEGTIVAAPKAGGTPRVLASDRGLPGPIALHGDALTWVEKRSESLWTMPTAGGTPARLTQDFAGFADVVVDARGASWVPEEAVDGVFHVLSLGDAGEANAISPAARSIDAIASDGTHLYWAHDGQVGRLR